SICRNEDGVLDYAQTPYEGGFRPVLTGHFIAMKVENIGLKITDVDDGSAKIIVKDEDNSGRKLAVKLTYQHNDEEKEEIIDLNNEELVLNDLYTNTKYNVQVLIKEDTGYKELHIKDAFTTLKNFPSVNKVKIKILSDSSYEITLDVSDVDEVVQKASIYVNGKKKSIKVGDDPIVITYGKNTDSILNTYFEFDCVFNGQTRTIRIDDYNLVADLDVYVEHIKSQIDAFFNFE
ncbi:MAG: hypothetical protein K6E74_01520, partial [Bacilli bacterium]|nr:hypothetical protein [Bacilli bacterium]